MRWPWLLLLLTLLPLAGRAAAPNPWARQCDRLATTGATAPLFRYLSDGGFWKDRAMGAAFISARDTGRAVQDVGATDRQRLEDRAAVVLAAIVRRDLPLLRASLDPDVEAYFRGTGMTVLTAASSCNFTPGVRCLLAEGQDPNMDADVGAFNLALLYGNDALAEDLLQHGYRIDADTRRCRSSKGIASRPQQDIDPALRAQIAAARCPSTPMALGAPGR